MLAYAPSSSYHYPHYHTPFHTPPAPLSPPSTSPSSSPTSPLPVAVTDVSPRMQEVVPTEASKRTVKECSGIIAPSVGSHGIIGVSRNGQSTVSSTYSAKGVGGSVNGSVSGAINGVSGTHCVKNDNSVKNVNTVSGVNHVTSSVKQISMNSVSGVKNNSVNVSVNGAKHMNDINVGVNGVKNNSVNVSMNGVKNNNVNVSMNGVNGVKNNSVNVSMNGIKNNSVNVSVNGVKQHMNGMNVSVSVSGVDDQGNQVKKLLDSYNHLALKESMIIEQLIGCNNSLSSSTNIKNLGYQLNSILIEKMKQLYTIVGKEGEEEEHTREDVIHHYVESTKGSGMLDGKTRKKSKIGVNEHENQSNDEFRVKDISQNFSNSTTKVSKGVSSSPPPSISTTTTTTTTNPVTTGSPSKSIPIVIEEQPSGNVVANKYLEPPIVARVNSCYLSGAREGRLRIAASLCLTFSDETIQRTLDNKQDILQGRTVVPVSTEGYVTFNKLKIMEVSSKHHHHSFSISLQLQELKKVGNDVTIVPLSEPIKSAPLHVQSRINKRKRSSSSCSFSSSAPNTTTRPKKRSRRGSSGEADSNYVDITSLLVLPQKEAASRLGISESMLCKRFKECTRRKWPYRYLRKIDKMIKVISLNKKTDPSTKEEDVEKIQRLKHEREECLQPVKIRITGHDKAGRRAGGVSLPSVSDDPGKMSDSDSEMSSNSTSPCDEEDEEEVETGSIAAAVTGRCRGRRVKGTVVVPVVTATVVDEEDVEPEEETGMEDEDEIAVVASTLNLLKQGGGGGDQRNIN